jgi:hypothetical protein
MPNKQPTTNAQLPDRLYGEHYPDSFLDVSESVRKSSVATLGDYIRHLQEVGKQPDQPCFACEPSGSDESKFDHICPNNPILTCNCTDPKFCAELGSDPDGTSAKRATTEKGRDGNKRCPESGRVCNDRVCPNECIGDEDGFADNINYTGIPYPKGKDAVSGWPCVVVGAICETWTSAAERVLRTTASEWDTKQHTDAGFNNDGPVATNGL